MGDPEEYESGQARSSYEAQSEEGTRHDEGVEMAITLLRPGEVLQGTSFQLTNLKHWKRSTYLEPVGVNACPRFPAIELTGSDVTRWKMASRLMERYGLIDIDFKIGRSSKMIHRRCKDWPEVDLIYKSQVALGFSVAALIYGGLHALAWSAHFDSFTEQLLWRMSACVVMGGFPSWYIINGLEDWYAKHEWQEIRLYLGKDSYLRVVYPSIKTVASVLLCLILLAYILARAYLVVESFINLSHLPAGAYDLPRWSAYFPHVS